MKRIYKNNDLVFNLTVNNYPINKDLIDSIEFKFYTTNPNNCIIKSENDIDIHNQIILQWNELQYLEKGVMYYDCTVRLTDSTMYDGKLDTVTKKMTNYYIVTGNETIDINSDMANYYTKDEIDDLIANIEAGEVDLTKYYTKSQIDIKLNGYVEDDVLGSYYTKNEVNDLIDGLSTGGTLNVDLTDYYTKTEVNNLIPTDYLTSIPAEYVTETELNNKGYLTQHQSLTNYYTKGEVNNLIDGLSTGDGEVNLTNYYTKDEVNNLIPKDYLTEIPSEFITETELNKSLSGYAKLTDIPTDYIKEIPSEYITESELNDKGYLTEHQSLSNYYTKSEVDNKINNSGNFDSTQYYTKSEVDNKIPTDYLTSIPSEYITETELTEKGYLTQHQSLDNYYTKGEVDNKIPTDYIKTIPSEYITETELNTSLNGYSTTSHTHSEYITEQYDDTALANRVSALESELTGVSEQITELNNMVV